jgi:CRP/FNR family transcriptional regulator, cyclic AMP receptor protein
MKLKALWENPFKVIDTGSKAELAFLSSIPLFDTLTTRQKGILLKIVHIRTFKDGEIVFRQGDPGVGLYVVREGQFEVYHEHPDLTRRKIATIEQGDFFGEISLLNDSPRSATVVSSQESTLYGLFRPDLLEIMGSDPKMGLAVIYRIAQIIAERLRLVSNNISG